MSPYIEVKGRKIKSIIYDRGDVPEHIRALPSSVKRKYHGRIRMGGKELGSKEKARREGYIHISRKQADRLVEMLGEKYGPSEAECIRAYYQQEAALEIIPEEFLKLAQEVEY